MSGECDTCGNHTLECCCFRPEKKGFFSRLFSKKKVINIQEIPYKPFSFLDEKIEKLPKIWSNVEIDQRFDKFDCEKCKEKKCVRVETKDYKKSTRRICPTCGVIEEGEK